VCAATRRHFSASHVTRSHRRARAETRLAFSCYSGGATHAPNSNLTQGNKMKKLIVVVSALSAFALFVRSAAAEEKNPGKLFKMLEDKFAAFKDLGPKYQENAKFKEFIKHTCQKGNLFGGVFGVCRSGEGIVCGFKKEAFVACSLVCGGLAKGMKEAAGFEESKCVTKHDKKWGFEGQEEIGRAHV